jgi:hypothetical protein
VGELGRFEGSDAYSEFEKDVLRFTEPWTLRGRVDDAVMSRVGGLSLFPPPVQAIDDEVAGLPGVAEQQPRLVDRDRPAIQFEHPERDQHGTRGHVVR